MFKITISNTKRIYAQINQYELIFTKSTHLINCTCTAEVWDRPCKHKKEFYLWLYNNNKLTSPRVIDWVKRELL